jgi:putative membrane protein
MLLLVLHAKDLYKALQDKKITTYQQVEIDNTLTRLCDAMGKCERIKNTVSLTTYSIYILVYTLFIYHFAAFD